MMMKLEQKTKNYTNDNDSYGNSYNNDDQVEIKTSTVLVSQVKLMKNIINIEERHKDVN